MTQQNTHTPGPWVIEPIANQESIGGYNIMTEEGFAIANTAAIYSSIDDEGQHKANARLIAAAPELLQALELAEKRILKLREHVDVKTFDDLNDMGTVDILNIRAAIAKAKGDAS